MADQINTVAVNIRCLHTDSNFAFDLAADLEISHIPGVIKKLVEVGIEPGCSQYQQVSYERVEQPATVPAAVAQPVPVAPGFDQNAMAAQAVAPAMQAAVGQAPYCPVHQRPMKPSKYPGGSWYCTARTGQDAAGQATYCDQQIASQ